MYYAFDGAPPPPRTGASHASIYPYGPFEAGDGGTVMLGLQNEREWKTFCEQVLLQPALAVDARFDSNAQRNAHREELRALILGVFNALDAAQVVQRLDAAGIANARVNDMAGLWSHPQLAARQRWRAVDTPAGPVQALLPPGANSAFDYRMEAVPAVGEHSAAILAELGRARRGRAQRRHPGRAGLERRAHRRPVPAPGKNRPLKPGRMPKNAPETQPHEKRHPSEHPSAGPIRCLAALGRRSRRRAAARRRPLGGLVRLRARRPGRAPRAEHRAFRTVPGTGAGAL
jgi:hypothetical protein